MYGREQSGIRLEMTKKPIILSAFDNSSTGILTVHHLTIIRRMVYVAMITDFLSQFRSKHRQIDTGGRSKHGDERDILLGEIG